MNKGKKLAPIHPGEILREEFLAPLELSMSQLALDLHVPSNRITEIVHGERAITIDTALRLGRYFGTSPRFWLNLQLSYELDNAEDRLAAEIARDVQARPFLPAPV